MLQHGNLFIERRTPDSELTLLKLKNVIDETLPLFKNTKSHGWCITRLEVDAKNGLAFLDEDVLDFINCYFKDLFARPNFVNNLDFIEIYKPGDELNASLIFVRICDGEDTGLYSMHHHMDANIDYVVYRRGESDLWELDIARKAISASEVFEEMLNITEQIFETFNGFFIPTEIDYTMITYSNDFPPDKRSEYIIKRLDSIRRNIRSDTGISYQNFLDDIRSVETPESVVKCIWGFKISGKVKILLEVRDDYIDKNSLAYLIEYDDFPYPPSYNPIEIKINFKTFGSESGKEASHPYYTVDFMTYTDIWFEDSMIGQVNGDRLKILFKKFYNNFYVIGSFILPEFYSEKKLKEFFP